ncbi:MAG TPA: transglycosylase domain-containing protein [Actinomycetota bacterium]|nr:transglycosylase domain-containing protein [Actinomycetota bacterium]
MGRTAGPRRTAVPAAVRAAVASLVIAVLLGTGLFAVVNPVGAGVDSLQALFSGTKVPPAPRLPQTTFVYDRHGHLLAELHGGENRIPVPLAKVPKVLQHAVIAAEDANFYHEDGVNFGSILRAAYVNFVQGHVVEGGSTITQQYVKDVYTTGQRTVARKIREAIIAQKLSRSLSKQQILERYLNEVYFGHGAYGVEAAALAYYGQDVWRLNLQQSATLAGVIAAPTQFDPISSPDQAEMRRNYVLGRMAALHMISFRQARDLSSRSVHTSPPPAIPNRAPSFLNFVKKRLEGRFGVKGTFEGGLRVTTTIDLRMQRIADRVVRDHLPAPSDPSAALVAIDPSNGQVLAMVGGARNGAATNFNLATQARRQAGSAFKAFTLATAVHQGISLLSSWNGPPSLLITDPRCQTPDPQTNVPGPWDVSNYADESAGTMNLLDATANSVNTIYSQLVLDVGPDSVAAMANRMGVAHHLDPVCSITLGTQTVTPLDMATGYATLASGGIRHNPTGIAEVDGPTGNVIVRPDGTPRRVLTTTEAGLVTYALEGVVTHGTGTAAALADRPAAGKTGTAQNFQDAWFCGYVPQLATCVWVGYPQGEIPMQDVEGFPEVFGGSIPAEIWHDFMTEALVNTTPEQFATPDLNGYDTTPPLSIGSANGAPSQGDAVPGPNGTPSPAGTLMPTPTP